MVALRLGLSLPTDRHRALPDVLLTARILLQLLELGKIRSLEELRTRASPNRKDRSHSLGKRPITFPYKSWQ